MKKLLSTALALLLAFGTATGPLSELGVFTGSSVEAVSYDHDDNYVYTLLDNGTYEVTSYTGTAAEVTIPSEFNGKSITSIAGNAFSYHEKLTSIEIPNSVETIGYEAFAGCTSLVEIALPEKLETIEEYAFKNCTKLEKVTMSDNVKTIGTAAFEGCTALKTVDLSEGLTAIGDEAFADCIALEYVLFPASLKTIGASAFFGDKGLGIENGLVFPQGLESVGKRAFGECILLTEVTLPASLKTIGDQAFGYHYYWEEEKNSYGGVTDVIEHVMKMSSLTIYCPANSAAHKYAKDNGLEYVLDDGSETDASRLFFDYEIRSDGTVKVTRYLSKKARDVLGEYEKDVVIPRKINGYKVTVIGEDTFSPYEGNYHYHIESITIPDTVRAIYVRNSEQSPFWGCVNLENFYVDAGNEDFSSEDGILYNKDKTRLVYCPIGRTELKIPKGVITICKGAFSRCEDLVGVSIPNTVTYIDDAAFSSCTSLYDITIPDSVTYIGDSAFFNCDSFTSVNIPDSVTKLGAGAFGQCDNLESVTLSNSLEDIEASTFDCCNSLKSITIPDGVKSIGNNAFWYCGQLETVILPNSLTTIVTGAFDGCNSLKSITIPRSVTSIGEFSIGCDMTAGHFTDGFVIYGYKGTAAETYAKGYSLTFVPLDGESADLTLALTQGGKDGKAIPLNDVKVTFVDTAGVKTAVNGVDDGTVIESPQDGKYTLIAEKEGYAPREYTVEIKNGELVDLPAIELHQYGDVTGDGTVDTSDWAMLKGSLQGIIKLDTYDELVADADQNGKKEVSDATTLKAKITGLIR